MRTIVIASLFMLSSCNLTVAPDGTRSWSLNAEIARAVIVKATK